jgi:hypothetical protein
VPEAALAATIATAARGCWRPGSATAVRLGVDGPVETDSAALADRVAAELAGQGVPVARVSACHYLRARSLRLEFGADDPDTFLDGWYDTAALLREVLTPLAGPGGALRWLPRLRDPDTDRPYREPARTAAPGTVLVLDGRFLLRGDLAAGLDLVVHLDVSPAARARRVPAPEQARVLPAWARYRAEDDPAGRAGLVVRYDHPRSPALASR